MRYGRNRNAADALLADAPLAQQHGLRADQAEVVQRLHHRQSELVSGPEDRRRNQREGVVGVQDIGLLVAHQLAQLVTRLV